MHFNMPRRRTLTVLELVLIAIAAYFQASGAMKLLGSAMAPSASSAVATLPAPGPSALDDHATSARSILERNPFDSTTRSLRSAVAGDAAVVVDLDHYENAPACDGFRAFIVVASPDRDWSMAALSGGGASQTRLVRIGEEVGHKVVRIVEWNRVVLSSGSSLCQVQMFQSNPASRVAAGTKARTEEAPPSTGSVPPAIASKIQRVSATEFNVDRQAIAEILENQAELMRFVRLVPDRMDGKVVGIRLYGVRPDTLLGLLGLEQGDRLQTINGFDMTSPENALQALARLRTADHLTVQVNRRDKDTNIDFNVK